MKKLMVLLALMLFFYPLHVLSKPNFNILDSECIVFIQGSSIDSNISLSLESFLNTIDKANLQIWYIKKDLYSRIKFNNNTYLELDNLKKDDSEIFLYKKGRSYYQIDLQDENMSIKVNKYFGRQIFPIYEKRSKTVYEKEYQGAIYVDYSEKELYDLTHSYLDIDEYEIYAQTQKQKKSSLIANMQILKIPYKEVAGNVKTISFPNKYDIDLEDKGGSVILFIQSSKPYIVPLSSLNITELNKFFNNKK